MERKRLPRSVIACAVAAAGLAGVSLAPAISGEIKPGAAPSGVASELAAMRSEIKSLRDQIPGQAHVMIDVGQHFSGLWFAVQNQNWDLARFMLSETQSHLRWAVRVRPVRKLSTGVELQLEGILTGLENGVLDKLRSAVEGRNAKEFESAYRTTVEGCNSCHRAAEKPFLQVRIPAVLGQPLEFKPAARSH
jgi:hypothetical protein